MGKLSKIYRELPGPMQKFIKSSKLQEIGLELYRSSCRRRIIREYTGSMESEEAEVAKYVKENGLEVIPYDFTKKYDYRSIKVIRDKDGYPYTMHKGKKLYGRKDDTNDFFAHYYSYTMMEQDKESPHCYVANESRIPRDGCIIAELGAAEGMFALDYIERAKKVYLFESSPKWQEPLRRTFAPWSAKIKIVPYFVGAGGDKNNTIQLDDYFRDKDITIVKADIERAEVAMLHGGVETFSNKIKQAYICTYHNYDHPMLIEKYLREHGFKTEFNKRYMLMHDWPSDFDKNMLRRGVIYAEKE